MKGTQRGNLRVTSDMSKYKFLDVKDKTRKSEYIDGDCVITL